MKQLMAEILVIVCLALPATAAVRYIATDLGTLGGANSFSTALNNKGQVVGYSETLTGTTSFIWQSQSQMLTLGDSLVSQAYGLNDSGWVVGAVVLPCNGMRAALWCGDNSIRILSGLGGSFSYATSVNNRGEVAGTAAVSYGNWSLAHASLWHDDQVIDLGTLGGWTSHAFAINNSSQIVGEADLSSGTSHATLWESDVPIDLGTLPGGTFSRACDINNIGVIAGFSATSSGTLHATLWRDGTVNDLGAFGGKSWATAINDRGQIVGYAETSMGFRGVVWQNGQIVDINTFLAAGSNVSIITCDDINNRGQIVGRGYRNGSVHAYLLMPIVTVKATKKSLN